MPPGVMPWIQQSDAFRSDPACLSPQCLPAPVTTVWPSGEEARYRTRIVWPVSVASLVMEGQRHTMIWFWLYPCVDTSSFTFLLQERLQT